MAGFLPLFSVMATENPKVIPPQQEGKQSDIMETRKAASPEEAKGLFVESKKRLLDVNRWAEISEGISASFVLTDQSGQPKQGIPGAGDYFKIDIPGPGSSAGEGYDWVRVELVEDHRQAEADKEWVVMKVRPSQNPVSQKGVAHFFDKEATSSFIVKREKNILSAEVHGRNEKPNTEAEKIPDKIRNAVIGTGALAGLSNIQWEKLVKGLLNGKSMSFTKGER
jgi:hypothetical protein